MLRLHPALTAAEEAAADAQAALRDEVQRLDKDRGLAARELEEAQGAAQVKRAIGRKVFGWLNMYVVWSGGLL